ncbi:MAG: alpha/beta hydrolase [Alphaproteobacteria bacterium]
MTNKRNNQEPLPFSQRVQAQLKAFLWRQRDIIILCVGFYCFCLGYLYLFQRDFMYFPGGVRPDIAVIIDESLRPQVLNLKTADGLEISGWFWPPEKTEESKESKESKEDKSKPVIVYFHGNAQNYGYWIDKALIYVRSGYGFVLAEYRGYGGNMGRPSEQGLFEDARTYLNFLINDLNYTPQDIVLLGESLGTGIAVQMASERPVRAVVLQSPYTSTLDVARNQYWMFPVKALMKDQFRSDLIVPQLENLPLLIIHGEDDDLIPVHMAQRLYELAQPPKNIIVMPHTGHNDTFTNGADQYVLDFLAAL